MKFSNFAEDVNKITVITRHYDLDHHPITYELNLKSGNALWWESLPISCNTLTS